MADMNDMIETIEAQTATLVTNTERRNAERATLEETAATNATAAESTESVIADVQDMVKHLSKAIEDAAMIRILQSNIQDQTTLLNVMTAIVAKGDKSETERLKRTMEDMSKTLASREHSVHVGDNTNISGGNNINQFGDNATGTQGES